MLTSTYSFPNSGCHILAGWCCHLLRLFSIQFERRRSLKSDVPHHGSVHAIRGNEQRCPRRRLGGRCGHQKRHGQLVCVWNDRTHRIRTTGRTTHWSTRIITSLAVLQYVSSSCLIQCLGIFSLCSHIFARQASCSYRHIHNRQSRQFNQSQLFHHSPKSDGCRPRRACRCCFVLSVIFQSVC